MCATLSSGPDRSVPKECRGWRQALEPGLCQHLHGRSLTQLGVATQASSATAGEPFHNQPRHLEWDTFKSEVRALKRTTPESVRALFKSLKICPVAKLHCYRVTLVAPQINRSWRLSSLWDQIRTCPPPTCYGDMATTIGALWSKHRKLGGTCDNLRVCSLSLTRSSPLAPDGSLAALSGGVGKFLWPRSFRWVLFRCRRDTTRSQTSRSLVWAAQRKLCQAISSVPPKERCF